MFLIGGVCRRALLAAVVGLTGYTVALALETTDEKPVTASEDGEPAEEVMPPAESESVPRAPLNPKWSPPEYGNQTQALGWSEETFRPPPGLQERVNFWKDIYSKYTSEQGVLHDSRHVPIVYETVEFGDISAREDLTFRQKERARRKRVDERKREILARLRRLQELKSAEGLQGEDARVWEMFASVDEPKKFAEAARRGRLRFQLGQRDIFVRGIYQSGRYLRQMEDIFQQEGLPRELTRLPFVESSFNLKARSRVGASGIWQFMRSTARMYMRMDGSADERNDPLRATRAAAKKLRDNFNMLKSWPLAVTAYNHGPAGVKRLTEKMGTTDIAELTDVRKGRFKFASASFFASFLAAVDVEKNAGANFGSLDLMPELKGAEIQLTRNQPLKDFLKWFNGDLDLARLLNPHVAESVWKGRTPLSRRHFIRVPLLSESQARGELR